MTKDNTAHKVEKVEVRPGQYLITDRRYRMPSEGEREVVAVWEKRFEKAGKIIRESAVRGSAIRIESRKRK